MLFGTCDPRQSGSRGRPRHLCGATPDICAQRLRSQSCCTELANPPGCDRTQVKYGVGTIATQSLPGLRMHITIILPRIRGRAQRLSAGLICCRGNLRAVLVSQVPQQTLVCSVETHAACTNCAVSHIELSREGRRSRMPGRPSASSKFEALRKRKMSGGLTPTCQNHA